MVDSGLECFIGFLDAVKLNENIAEINGHMQVAAGNSPGLPVFLSGFRQAAPFAKPLKTHPQRPRRKPGSAYGPKASRRPARVDERYDAPLPRIVPIEDEDCSKELARAFGRRGIALKTGVKVASVKPGGPGAVVETDGGKLEAELVLMAVGRAAKVAGLGLEALGIVLDRGFVKVSPRMETGAKGVYAIGDMAGPPLLAHKAMAEGVVAAEAIAGRDPRPVDYANVPSCTYCRPQVASLGATEAKAREHGRDVAVGKFPFTASGKAVALGETDGFVKVVADKATGELLGVHIVGPEATEIIHEFAVGRTLEATLEEMVHTIHAHPTLSEAALEATLGALGQAIHL